MPEVTTSESIVRQAPFLEDFQRQLLTGVFGTEGDPTSGIQPIDIPGVTVAGLQPLQQQAIIRAQQGGVFKIRLFKLAHEVLVQVLNH